jgi:hypothetical protein
MSDLNKEINNIQNPALGAYIIWNFVRGYYNGKALFVPFPLLFIVLPIMFREDMVEVLYGTNKPTGLRNYADKFTSKQILKNDVISQLPPSSEMMMGLTLQSIKVAIRASLISIDVNNAFIFPISMSEHKSEPKSIVQMGRASEKLGYWCSQVTLHEISQILKVRF